jgi:DNA-binding response OmpR family regulator
MGHGSQSRWIKTETGDPRSGQLMDLGSANTDSRSCDLLLFALPQGQGLKLWQKIQSEHGLNKLPVLVLTAQDQEMIRILGFANDENSQRKVGQEGSLAQFENLLHELQFSEEFNKPVETAELVISPSSYCVTRDGKQTTLSVLEFRLLYYLASRPNRYFTRNQLFATIWRGSRSLNPRVVDVYIRRLRMKIEADPESPAYLKTLRGMGYLFDPAPRKLTPLKP